MSFYKTKIDVPKSPKTVGYFYTGTAFKRPL